MSDKEKKPTPPPAETSKKEPANPRPELKPHAAAAAETNDDSWLDAHIERANELADARQGAMAELPSSQFRKLVEAVKAERLPSEEAREALKVYEQACKPENYRGDPPVALPAESYHMLVSAAV